MVSTVEQRDYCSLFVGVFFLKSRYRRMVAPHLDNSMDSDWVERERCDLGLDAPPKLNRNAISKLSIDSLFYVFYGIPKSNAQLLAAQELYKRGWMYHKYVINYSLSILLVFFWYYE